MTKIFLSYRRSDSGEQTERLHDRLVKAFGEGNVFLDVARGNIHTGADFAQVLRENVVECDVVVVVIGKKWLDIREDLKPEMRRLENPHDFVRIEIESAFNAGKIIMPILVGGAEPIYGNKLEMLPESLRPITQLQFTPIRPNPDFHNDVTNLIRDIKARTSSPNRTIGMVAGAAAILIMAVLAGIMFFSYSASNNDSFATATPANPQTQAAMILTVNALPTATNTEDADATVGALLTEFAQTATAKQQVIIDNYTATPSPTDDTNATQTREAAERAATQSQEQANIEASENAAADTAEAITQIAQLTANAPTNTPQPTRTLQPTQTPSPRPTSTQTPRPTSTPNLSATAVVSTATQRAFLTQAAEAVAATQRAEALSLDTPTIRVRITSERRLKAEPTIDSQNLAFIPDNIIVTVYARSGYWYLIEYPVDSGSYAWMNKTSIEILDDGREDSLLDYEDIPSADERFPISSIPTLRVRVNGERRLKAEPAIDSQNLVFIPDNILVTVYAKSGYWYLIEYPVDSGSYAWMNKTSIEILDDGREDSLLDYEDIPSADERFPISSIPTLRVRVNGERRLKAEPAIDSQNLVFIPDNILVTVYAKSGYWYLIEYPVDSGSYAWMNKTSIEILDDGREDSLLDYEDIPSADERFPISSIPTLRVRVNGERRLKAEPAIDSQNLAVIPDNILVTVYARSGYWYLIEYPVGSGSYAWMNKTSIEILDDGREDSLLDYEDILNAETLFPIGSP